MYYVWEFDHDVEDFICVGEATDKGDAEALKAGCRNTSAILTGDPEDKNKGLVYPTDGHGAIDPSASRFGGFP